jgi:translation elongation factor P/translation initiation factor 5A
LTAKSANGVRGHLLNLFNGEYVFRVYDADHNFVDYDIHHSDLCVTIDDPDAYFYDDEFSSKLDHAPETLGIKNDT